MCIEKFIPKTNKRYSITEDGVVYSHYKYGRNHKKVFRKRELKKTIEFQNDRKTCIVSLYYNKYCASNETRKNVLVTTLMEKCFLLSPPDKFHRYHLHFKDGNCFNTSLSNLEYKISIKHTSKYKCYPQPFYNSDGMITHKRCGCCGIKKQIKNFFLFKGDEKIRKRTFLNYCKNCKSNKTMQFLKNDTNRLAKYKLYQKKWNKKSSKFHCENITKRYVANGLNMSIKDVTPEILSLSKKKITLFRTVKKHKNEKPTKSTKSTIKTKKGS